MSPVTFAARGPLALPVESEYEGPGDIAGLTTGVMGWWGLRAFSADTRGDPAVRLIRSGGSGGGGADEQDISTDASTGHLDVANSFFSGSGYTYKVVTLYDQAEGAYGDMSAHDSPTSRPVFTLSGLNGLPTIVFATTADLVTPMSGADMDYPLLFSTVARRTSGNNFSRILCDGVGAIGITFSNGVLDSVSIHSSSGGSGAINIPSGVTEGDFHAIAGQFAVGATASTIAVDGAINTGDLGNASPDGDLGFAVCWTILSPRSPADGVEWGAWSGDKTSYIDALIENQTDYWGPF